VLRVWVQMAIMLSACTGKILRSQRCEWFGKRAWVLGDLDCGAIARRFIFLGEVEC